MCAQQLCVFIVFVLEPTQLSAELHVALQPCLHFKEFKRASSKHSPGKVSTDEHSVAARRWRKLFVHGALIGVCGTM